LVQYSEKIVFVGRKFASEELAKDWLFDERKFGGLIEESRKYANKITLTKFLNDSITLPPGGFLDHVNPKEYYIGYLITDQNSYEISLNSWKRLFKEIPEFHTNSLIYEVEE